MWAEIGAAVLFLVLFYTLYKMFWTKEWQFWTSDLPDDIPGRD